MDCIKGVGKPKRLRLNHRSSLPEEKPSGLRGADLSTAKKY